MYSTTNSSYGSFYKRISRPRPQLVKLYGDCNICCDDIKYELTRILYCGHFFHAKCIEIWLSNNTKCPICRKETN